MENVFRAIISHSLIEMSTKKKGYLADTGGVVAHFTLMLTIDNNPIMLYPLLRSFLSNKRLVSIGYYLSLFVMNVSLDS